MVTKDPMPGRSIFAHSRSFTLNTGVTLPAKCEFVEISARISWALHAFFVCMLYMEGSRVIGIMHDRISLVPPLVNAPCKGAYDASSTWTFSFLPSGTDIPFEKFTINLVELSEEQDLHIL